ncbi:hypothetical protein D3C86_2185560 [compost metagenome]
MIERAKRKLRSHVRISLPRPELVIRRQILPQFPLNNTGEQSIQPLRTDDALRIPFQSIYELVIAHK